MDSKEKRRLLALLARDTRWCQHAEARDARGEPVRYDDVTAVSWDVTGAMCRLFGWRRSRQLFRQIGRHICASRVNRVTTLDIDIVSMVALQEFNDRDDTTFELIVDKLRSLRVSEATQ